MKKRSAIHLILFAALVLLAAQLSLLAILLYPHSKRKTDYSGDIQIISNITAQLQLQLIIIDKIILDNISGSKKSSDTGCPWCTEDRIVSFATLFRELKNIEVLVRRAEDEGFKTVVFHNVHPVEKLPTGNSDIPVCVFLKHKAVIQLVLFHDREANFWWHGSIHSDPDALHQLFSLGVNQGFSFMNHEGAYDKFVTEKLDLHGTAFYVPKNIPDFLHDSLNSRFLECRHQSAHQFYQKYGKDKSHEALRFSHRAWKLLSRTKTILDSIGVRFWLSSGTCLGYLRQCDIIPYGRDVDIGIFITDYNEKIVTEFLSHGFTLKHWFGKINDSLEISFKTGDIKLDIFFFYEEEYWVWNGGTQAKTGKKFKYIFPRFTLCWTEFLELKVRVPCETETYIEANYGKNWRIPVVHWDWKSSPPNVRENGVWPVQEWQHVIQVYD
ncbi:ribitol-5-phosphate transferase FKTN-like [Schistocerca cancellata]|uniref:ribitol-5-phosphate transferase FKTN-like n=1 Tax=Schistocerca cancellata TaxID=274614 RepID=UPI0021179E6D|nr:ribitol-5-phosphate transferase FKTN-like [Schistocerca cancellata]